MPSSFTQHRLSFTQERRMKLAAQRPDHPYNAMYMAFEWADADSEASIAEVLQQAACRHGSLSTTYHRCDGGAVQRVHRDGSAPLDRVDVVGPIESAIAAWAEAPFDLASLPTYRSALFRRSHGKPIVAISVPHISWDYRSWDLLFASMSAVLTSSEDNALRFERNAYGQFADAQRAEFNPDRLERERSSYRDQVLAGMSFTGSRPFPRLGEVGVGESQIWFDIPVAQRRPPAMSLLLGALSFSTARVLGEGPRWIGCHVDTRGSAQSGVAGLHTNFLPFYFTAPGKSPDDNLLEARQSLNAAMKFVKTPGIRGASIANSGSAGGAVCQFAVNYLPGVDGSRYPFIGERMTFPRRAVPFDLSLIGETSRQRLRLRTQHDPRVMDAGCHAAISGYVQRALYREIAE